MIAAVTMLSAVLGAVMGVNGSSGVLNLLYIVSKLPGAIAVATGLAGAFTKGRPKTPAIVGMVLGLVVVAVHFIAMMSA